MNANGQRPSDERLERVASRLRNALAQLACKPFARHAPQRCVDCGVVGKASDVAPCERMRFSADHEFLAAGRAHGVAHVVMPVFRFIATRRNAVAIEIEDILFASKIAQTRLLLGFAQGDTCKIGLAVGCPPSCSQRSSLR
jgi:hypothetical protein